jgi:hypothetical protein
MAGNLIYHTGMHSSRELRNSSFEVRVDGRPAGIPDLFEGFGEQDRLGVVMRSPCGAVGASTLITATITAFYDFHRARGDEFFVYPDYYLFHVGGPLGDHARLDVWPRRKEVVVGQEPQAILEAIDDRAITRLVVEDGAPVDAELDDEVVASARGRIATCLAYSPAGRLADADVEIAGNPVTEGYVEAILDPEARIERLRAETEVEADAAAASARQADAAAASARQADALHTRISSIEARLGEVDRDIRMRILQDRSALLRDGVPVETYRRISLDEALGLLGSPTPAMAG